MNPGYNSENLEMIKNNLSILGINAEFVETNIFDVANKIVKSGLQSSKKKFALGVCFPFFPGTSFPKLRSR